MTDGWHRPDWWELVPGWVEEYYRLGEENMKYEDLVKRVPLPRVHYRLTGKKAGWCAYTRREIALNPAMNIDQAHETLAHELAHYFAYYVHDERGHGTMFRMWMKNLGHTPSRCHNYMNVIATGRGDWYHCPGGCGLEIKTIKDGTRRYCRRCNRGRHGDRILFLRPGRATPEHKLAVALVAHGAGDDTPAGDPDTGAAIRGLKLELGILRDGGLGSSPAAKKLRRQLRKLGHRGGCHE